VTLHGREEVVVVSADEYRRLQGGKTGRHLIDAMQASPSRDENVEPERFVMPVRTMSL
jgi:PHD/YefM family antitoxin component YafN of YafNO toxin-antitoxin module